MGATALLLGAAAQANAATWAGGAAPSAVTSWSLPANWSGGTVPVAGEDVTFGASFGSSLNIDLAPANPVVGAFVVDTSQPFNLLSSSPATDRLTIQGGLTRRASASGTQTISAPVELGGSTPWGLAGTGALVVSGPISGDAQLTTTGTGTLVISNQSNYTGGTDIQGGFVKLGANNALPANSTLSIGSTMATGWLNLNGFSQSVLTLRLVQSADPTVSPRRVIGGGTLVLATSVVVSGSGPALPVLVESAVELTPGAHFFTTVGNGNAALGGDLQFRGPITGAGGVTVTGTPQSSEPVVSFWAPSSYAGSTTLMRGTLDLRADDAIPATSPFNQSTGTTLRLDGGGTASFSTGIGALSGAGSIVLGNNSVLTIGAANSDPDGYSGTIGGGGRVVKVGSGTLRLLASNTYTGQTTIQSGTVAISNSGGVGSGTLAVANGALRMTDSFTFANPVLLLGGTATFDNADLQTNTLSGVITGNGTLVISGLGSIALAAQNRYTGHTLIQSGTLVVSNDGNLGTDGFAPITFDGGALRAAQGLTTSRPIFVAPGGGRVVPAASTVRFLGPVTGPGTLNLTGFFGGTLDLANVRAGGLRIDSGTVRIAPNGTDAGTSRVSSLLLSGFFGPPRLDITDNAVVVDYTGPSPLSDLREQIQSGYAGGAWTGSGIVSSLADAGSFAVGYAEASDVFATFPATFAGQAVDDTSFLMTFTRYGDANLDQVVNLSDFNRLAANFGTGGGGAVWSQGDFNYDGVVNLSDFNLLAANFGQAATGTEVTPQDWANLAAAVPEPVMSGPAVAAGVLLYRRRRR